MKTIEYHTNKDKAAWGNGPWLDEPDKVQWQDEETGLPCMIKRNPMGALCGYVGVSRNHPCYERDIYSAEVEVLDVHGGPTYAAFCDGDEETGICHLVEPGEDAAVWWLGFDCAHAGDLTPHLLRYDLPPLHDETYKDINYVRSEVLGLARQLKDAALIPVSSPSSSVR